MNKDIKPLYIKGKGGGKRNMFVDYLINEGLDVKIVDSAGDIRGMSFDCIIVDELAKESKL